MVRFTTSLEMGKEYPPLAALIEDAAKLFGVICDFDETFEQPAEGSKLMTKAALIAAQGGDFKLHGKIDVDGDGFVELSEWCDFLKEKYNEKGEAKGGKWLYAMLQSLNRNIEKEQARVAAAKKAAADAAAAEEKAAADAAAAVTWICAASPLWGTWSGMMSDW